MVSASFYLGLRACDLWPPGAGRTDVSQKRVRAGLRACDLWPPGARSTRAAAYGKNAPMD
jgi:hypothetical protein